MTRRQELQASQPGSDIEHADGVSSEVIQAPIAIRSRFERRTTARAP
jgi:hypothetical protein